MRRIRAVLLLATALNLAFLTACGGEDRTSLSVQWQLDADEARAIRPSEAIQTAVRLTNDGSTNIEGLALRFDQADIAQMPFGISVGTATSLSSRFDGNAQVWDLGTLAPGQTLVFPISLWFDATTVTLEPRRLSLYINAESPDLEGRVVSNALEVEVDTRASATR